VQELANNLIQNGLPENQALRKKRHEYETQKQNMWRLSKNSKSIANVSVQEHRTEKDASSSLCPYF
jgi:hypothetical protein